MRGDREQVRIHLAQADGHLARRLDRIHVEHDLALAAQPGQLGHGLKDAGFIVRPHQGAHRDFAGELGGELFQAHVSVGTGRNADHDRSARLQLCGCRE